MPTRLPCWRWCEPRDIERFGRGPRRCLTVRELDQRAAQCSARPVQGPTGAPGPNQAGLGEDGAIDLSTFYALMSVTCFTLVGLWWTAIERHDEWRDDQRLRQLAGGTYLSFLLPGVMSMFAQVNPDNPLTWRISFGLTSIVGLVTSVRLIGVESRGHVGPFRRFRWLAPVLYSLIVVLGVAPEVALLTGAAPLQVASVLLMLLILLAHGLTWEFLMEPDPEPEVRRQPE